MKREEFHFPSSALPLPTLPSTPSKGPTTLSHTAPLHIYQLVKIIGDIKDRYPQGQDQGLTKGLVKILVIYSDIAASVLSQSTIPPHLQACPCPIVRWIKSMSKVQNQIFAQFTWSRSSWLLEKYTHSYIQSTNIIFTTRLVKKELNNT